jgi:hypothetical protein
VHRALSVPITDSATMLDALALHKSVALAVTGGSALTAAATVRGIIELAVSILGESASQELLSQQVALSSGMHGNAHVVETLSAALALKLTATGNARVSESMVQLNRMRMPIAASGRMSPFLGTAIGKSLAIRSAAIALFDLLSSNKATATGVWLAHAILSAYSASIGYRQPQLGELVRSAQGTPPMPLSGSSSATQPVPVAEQPGPVRGPTPVKRRS